MEFNPCKAGILQGLLEGISFETIMSVVAVNVGMELPTCVVKVDNARYSTRRKNAGKRL